MGSLISGIGGYALRLLSVLSGKPAEQPQGNPTTAGWTTIATLASAVFSIRPEMLVDVASAAHSIGRFLEVIATSLGAK